MAETGPWVDQDIKVCYYGMSTLPEVWKGYRMSMGEEAKGGSQFYNIIAHIEINYQLINRVIGTPNENIYTASFIYVIYFIYFR